MFVANLREQMNWKSKRNSADLLMASMMIERIFKGEKVLQLFACSFLLFSEKKLTA